MKTFDANVALGRNAAGIGPAYCNREDLITALDQAGSAMALVYSTLARETDETEGNRLLMETLAEEPRLLPCWVVIPNREPAELTLAKIIESGVRAVRLFPSSGHYSIAPWCIGELAAGLETHQVALFIDFEGPSWTNDLVDWASLDALCTRYPQLNITVCGVTMAGPSNYRPLLRQHARLHLELSQMVTPGEINRLVQEGHASQLIFGTQLPVRHPWAALAALEFSGVIPAALEQIASGNLKRILRLSESHGGAEIVAPTLPRDHGAIDTHVHLGGWNHSAAAAGRPEDVIASMDRCGVSSSIVTSLWACFGEVALGNADVAKACTDYPGRIHGYLTLDPKRQEEVIAQLALYGCDPGFRGLKLHEETQQFRIEEPSCEPILQFANAKGWPVLVHGRMDIPMWKELCARYPAASFILAHVGGAGPDSVLAKEFALCVKATPNLYLDIASTRNFNGFLPELIQLAGVEKILYGSDYPLMDYSFELGQVFSLPAHEQVFILRENARRLFHL